MEKQNLLNILETDDDYALMLVNRMILTLLESVSLNSKFAYKICAAIEGNLLVDFLSEEDLKFPRKQKAQKKDTYHYGGRPKAKAVNRDDWNELKQYFKKQHKEYEQNNPEKTPEIRNIEKLGKLVGFGELQCEALAYVYAISAADPAYGKLFGDIMHGHSSKFPALIAMAMEAQDSYKELSEYFGKSGIFNKYGIIEYDSDDGGMFSEETLPLVEEFLRDQIADGEISDDDLIDVLVGKSPKTDLTIKDNFPHLQDEAHKIADIIVKAYEQGKKGINIAIYGPTGSGKSEFTKALAKMMGIRLYAIGESESDNTQFSPDDKKISDKRMSSLLRAQAILKGDKKAALLMDEFEDLVPNKSDSSKQADPDSKILLNRTLEENFVVTFWACNDIGKFHESFRSRFFTSVSVGYQPTIVRSNIWKHHLEANDIELSASDVLSFARRYEAPPRAIAMACEGAALIGGNVESIHEQMEDKARILNGNRYAFEASNVVPADYDTEFLTCSDNFGEVTKAIMDASANNHGSIFMFKGEKGTGRSTYAYYLAEQMVRLPMEADMRDLIVPSQFSSPAGNLLGTFAHAADAKSLLIIDNFEALFKDAHGSDREEMSDIFWSFMRDFKAPVILMSEDTSKIDGDFMEYTDSTITFNPMDENSHKLLSSRIVGREDLPFNKGATIGNFMKAASSVQRIPNVEIDPMLVEKRIAASASLAAPSFGIVPKRT